MNPCCQSALHHINVAIRSILEIMDGLDECDLPKRPTPGKFSVGELLEHLAMLPLADSIISDGASQEEMTAFYSRTSYSTSARIRQAFQDNYESLVQKYGSLTEAQLQEEVSSYWGASYTRFGWLLEILAHLYHHRGQLHSMLVHDLGHDPRVSLFE